MAGAGIKLDEQGLFAGTVAAPAPDPCFLELEDSVPVPATVAGAGNVNQKSLLLELNLILNPNTNKSLLEFVSQEFCLCCRAEGQCG